MQAAPMLHRIPDSFIALIMKRFYCLIMFAFWILLVGNLHAQADQKLKEKLLVVESALKTVNMEKSVVNQQFSFNSDEPYSVTVKQEEIGQKGKTVQTIFEFNLADIDLNLINRIVKGKIMFVELRTRNQQKLIKESENGTSKGFVNVIKLFVNDVDESRTIIDNLKESVPISLDLMKKRLPVSGYSAMLDWLTANVGNVERAKGTFEQVFVSGDGVAGKVIVKTIENSGGKATAREYAFNLSDISPNLVSFDVEGKDVVVDLSVIRNADLIKVSENGSPVDYKSKFQLYANSIDQARDLVTILRLITEKAPEVVAAALPKLPSSPEPIIADVNLALSRVDVGQNQITQSFTGDCSTVFTQVTSTSKDSREEKYIFSFRDLNPLSIDFKTKGNLVYISLATQASQKLIKYEKNGQMVAYTDKFEIVADNPDDARLTVFRLKKTIELCNSRYRSEVPSGGMKVVLQWLAGIIGEVALGNETVNQVISNPEGDDVRLEVVTSGSKNSNTEVYELNLCDLDPNSIEFSVSGKNIFVKMATKYRQKIIKSYKNGKAQPFTSEIDIRGNDVESARNIIEGFKAALSSCK